MNESCAQFASWRTDEREIEKSDNQGASQTKARVVLGCTGGMRVAASTPIDRGASPEHAPLGATEAEAPEWLHTGISCDDPE